MKHFLFRPLAFLALAVVLIAGTATARQTDPRLDPLFARLADSHLGGAEAERVESEIWGIWHESGSASVDLLMQRGSAAMRAEDYETALNLFNSVVALEPDYAEGWNKRATLYYLMDDYESSLRDIRQTLALEPRHFGALTGLGMILRELGDEKGALKAFRSALDVNPHLDGARRHVKSLKPEVEGFDL